jgi:DNA-binding transcriptional MerR regulator
MKALGFTLGDIGRLLALVEGPRPRCGRVGTHIKQKLRELDQQIETLTRIRRELRTFFGECRKAPSHDVCRPLARILAI